VTKDSGGWGRSEEKRCYAVSSSKAINKRFIFSWLPPDALTGWPYLPKTVFYQPKIWLAHYAETFFYQTKIWRMNYNHNCKFNNFVKMSRPHTLQTNPKIYQRRNYVDHNTSIKLGDWGRSEEKRSKIREVGVGQRRRGAMLPVQSVAID
jgi:hypothetical protein